jgi:hypothetical protein
LFADQGGALQVVLGDEQRVEALALLRGEEAHVDAIEQALVVVSQNWAGGDFHAGEGKKNAEGCSVLSSIPLSHR